MTAATATTRLHITPLTQELLPSVVPASIRPFATDISFHCIPTFPENNYGYVTLPTMEAEKIKRKLNGSILKGKKFKVESARPSRKKSGSQDDGDAAPEHSPISSSSPSNTGSKKRKADDGAIDGYELPPGRQVKRGWTESTSIKKERRKEEKKQKEKGEKEKKTQARSKYTENSECLFRTKIPPNRTSAATADDKEEKKKAKKKKSSQESVVHEFSKTAMYPSFLRTGGDESTPTVRFEDGKGWVDNSGNVKEPVNSRIKTNNHRPGQVAGAKEKGKFGKALEKPGKTVPTTNKKNPVESADESEDWTSSSGSTSSDDDDTDSESDASTSSTSSSESEPSSVSSTTNEEDRKQHAAQGSEKATKSTRIESPEDPKENETENETSNKSPEKPPQAENIHPLEALYKRPRLDASEENKTPNEPSNTHFSFFGTDIEDIEEENENSETQQIEPHTPYTQKDLQRRRLRSAAPTPDTALVSRSTNKTDDMDVDMEDDPDEIYQQTPVPKHQQEQNLSAFAGDGDGDGDGTDTAKPKKQESEFAKWFWEHRGENNRAWKKRRREVSKEQRQKENRRKGMKGKS